MEAAEESVVQPLALRTTRTAQRGTPRERMLRRVEEVQRGSAARLRANGHQRAASQADRFAAWARLGVDHPHAMKRLWAAVKDLRAETEPRRLLQHALEGAISLTRADFGNLQILDPRAGSLRIAAQMGFGADFLEYFAVVDDDGSACGRAMQTHAQTVIADVRVDEGFAPHREIATASGFRAVQSTPIVDGGGRMLGVMSTHYRQPQDLPKGDLRVMECYSWRVAEVISSRLPRL